MILPSLSETWGLVVNEALACGTPALVSNRVGCSPDLIQEDVSGWVVDPDALAQNWKYLFILLGQAENDGPVLVVTSNGIARFARQVVETAPDLPESTDLKLKTGAFAKVRLEGGVATLAAWNVRP